MALTPVDLGPVIGPQGPAGEVDPTTPIPFTTPSTDADMASGDPINTLFGKIKKRLTVILDKIGDLTTLTTTSKTSAVSAINELNNNLATKMPKSGGTFTGPITATGNVKANNGRLLDKNGYVVSSGGGSNTVALVWTSAMRFDVYVDNTFVGTLTPVK